MKPYSTTRCLTVLGWLLALNWLLWLHHLKIPYVYHSHIVPTGASNLTKVHLSISQKYRLIFLII